MDVQCDADINKTKTQVRFNPDIQNVHLIRDWPFSLPGGGGNYGFFLKKKKIPIRNVAEKNILILVEGKKNRIQSFYHIT